MNEPIKIPLGVFTMVIRGLLLIALCGMVGEYSLVVFGKTPPESLSNLAHVALGALAGLCVVPTSDNAGGESADSTTGEARPRQRAADSLSAATHSKEKPHTATEDDGATR